MDPAERHRPQGETAGVIARPPLLFLGSLVLGLALDRLAPLPAAIPGPSFARWAAGGVAIALGIALFVAGVGGFARAKTPVPTNQPTLALVTGGVHGWTRNPIYLGFLLVYLGVGLAAGSLWVLVLFPPLALVIRYGVVAREEAYLERRFGEAYRAYKARVRRWI